jgi:signal transduction histidine kinase
MASSSKTLTLGAVLVTFMLWLTATCGHAYPLLPTPHEPSPLTKRIEECIKVIGAYQSQGHFDSSLVVNREALKLARSKGLTQYYSDLYSFLGYYYKANNEVDKATKLYKTAYYWCIKNRQTEKENWLTYRLASVYVDRCLIRQDPENFKIALRQIHKNLNLSESRQTPFNQICNYGLLVHLHQTYNNDALYLHYLSKVIAISKSRESTPKEKFYILIDEFGMHLGKGNMEKADEIFKTVLHLNETKEFSFVYSLYLIDMLLNYVNKGHYEIAETNILLIQQDTSIMKALGESDLMNFYYCLTRINIHNKNYDQARMYHQKCKSYIKKELFSWVKLNILENELALLEYDKKYKVALALQKEIAQAQNNRNKNQAIFELAVSQERFEMEHVAKELKDQLQIQELENKIKEDHLRQARQIQWLTLAIILLLGTVLLLIMWQVKKIKKQSHELASLNKQQTTLFGIIGHDLRSPVANLQNFLRTVSVPKYDHQFNDLFPELESRVSTLYNTLDNLLNWSLVQMNSLTVTVGKVSIADCVEDVLELLGPQIENKEITVLTTLDSKGVVANEHLLEVIVRNLLHNAIKFTPYQGFIKVSSVQEGAFVVLIIKDSGNGFPTQNVLNDSNSLHSSPGTDGETGTGMGLKLCMDLAKKMGGDLQIKSIPNQGATIRVRLRSYS